MLKLIPTPVCCVLFAFSAVAVAQNPQGNTVTKDPTAIAIAQLSLAAMSGTALTGFQDVTVTGTTTLYGDTSTVTYPITLMGTGRASVRSSIQKPSRTDVYVTDGFTACLNGSPTNGAADSSLGMLSRRIDFVPGLSILREYANGNMQVQYAGTDSVNGQPVDVIALSFQIESPPLGFDSLKATQRIFSIDRTSGFVVKAQYMTLADFANTSGPKTEVFYSNYQIVNGFAVPFSQVTYIDGKLGIELVLASATLNSGVPASSFAVSCEVANAQ